MGQPGVAAVELVEDVVGNALEHLPGGGEGGREGGKGGREGGGGTGRKTRELARKEGGREGGRHKLFCCKIKSGMMSFEFTFK